jgi:hypothetical protein
LVDPHDIDDCYRLIFASFWLLSITTKQAANSSTDHGGGKRDGYLRR